eukprot:1335653-Amorphochlora_amoeboformis.AAC.2
MFSLVELLRGNYILEGIKALGDGLGKVIQHPSSENFFNHKYKARVSTPPSVSLSRNPSTLRNNYSSSYPIE